MFNWVKSKFTKNQVKRIAFLDGDQPLPGIIAAYDAHLKGTDTETHLIKMLRLNSNEPKILRKLDKAVNKDRKSVV